MSVNVMQSPVGFRVSSSNHSNGNNQNTDHDHNEFIRSFHLNMLTSSSPILVRNGIEKLGDDCHGARMVRRYFENSNPHKVNIHIKQIWKVSKNAFTMVFFGLNFNISFHFILGAQCGTLCAVHAEWLR